MLSLLPHGSVLAVVAADSRIDSDRTLSPSSSLALVLTQECVCVFDVSTDTQLQSFAVADVDCQLTHSASDTILVFSRHVVATDIVSLNFSFYLTVLRCFDTVNWVMRSHDVVSIPHSWSKKAPETKQCSLVLHREVLSLGLEDLVFVSRCWSCSDKVGLPWEF